MLSREIINIYGSKTFMKVKANAFGIHKVLLAFGEFDPNTKALSKSIDFYILNVCFRLPEYVGLFYNRQKCIF